MSYKNFSLNFYYIIFIFYYIKWICASMMEQKRDMIIAGPNLFAFPGENSRARRM